MTLTRHYTDINIFSQVSPVLRILFLLLDIKMQDETLIIGLVFLILTAYLALPDIRHKYNFSLTGLEM